MSPIFSGSKKGISIIELLLVIAILAITLTVLLGMVSFSLGIQGLARQTTQANNLAQEAMEAVRSIRDNAGWPQITNGSHGLASVGGSWSFSGANDTIDGFVRTILIADAFRDAQNNLIGSGGTNDPDTKKITVSVSWGERGRNHSIELITYLTDWRQ